MFHLMSLALAIVALTPVSGQNTTLGGGNVTEEEVVNSSAEADHVSNHLLNSEDSEDMLAVTFTNHLEEAWEIVLSEMPQSEAAQLQKQKATLFGHILSGTEPGPGHPLLSPVSSAEALTLARVNPCALATAKAAVDAVFLALGCIGVHAANQERVARNMVRLMGYKALRGLAAEIHQISIAKSALAKGFKVFLLLKKIGTRGILAVTQSALIGMSALQKVKVTAIFSAQLVAWFGTTGAAFAAECVLVLVDVPNLIRDCIDAKRKC